MDKGALGKIPCSDMLHAFESYGIRLSEGEERAVTDTVTFWGRHLDGHLDFENFQEVVLQNWQCMQAFLAELILARIHRGFVRRPSRCTVCARNQGVALHNVRGLGKLRLWLRHSSSGQLIHFQLDKKQRTLLLWNRADMGLWCKGT